MTSWDFWSVISLMGILQAALLLVYFASEKKNYILPNLFIAALLVWIIWLQAEFLVLRRSFLIQSDIFFGSRHGIWFLLGPLLYHYLLFLFRKVDRLKPSMWLHYIPFVLFTVIIPLTVNETIPERVIGYGMLSVLKFPMLAHNWLNKAYGYLFIFQFIHAAVYLTLSIYTISHFQKESRESTSDNRQETLSLLKGVVSAISVFTVTSILFIGVLLKSQWYVRELDYIYILPLTFCVYLLSYFAARQPLSFQRKPAAPQKYQQSNLEKGISIRQFERLNTLIKEKKLYLNPELRLIDLYETTGISYHQLSEIINKEAGVSFFEFINQFRINEVLTTIENANGQGKKVNILEIAYASGFNNKVSFNRYFKKFTGETPTSFIKKTPERSKSL